MIEADLKNLSFCTELSSEFEHVNVKMIPQLQYSKFLEE